MRIGMAMLVTWIVALCDVRLSQALIDNAGPHAELNPLAAFLSATLGTPALLTYKVALMGLFTTIVLVAWRFRTRIAVRLATLSAVVHAGLAAWWVVVLRASGA